MHGEPSSQRIVTNFEAIGHRLIEQQCRMKRHVFEPSRFGAAQRPVYREPDFEVRARREQCASFRAMIEQILEVALAEVGLPSRQRARQPLTEQYVFARPLALLARDACFAPMRLTLPRVTRQSKDARAARRNAIPIE